MPTLCPAREVPPLGDEFWPSRLPVDHRAGRVQKRRQNLRLRAKVVQNKQVYFPAKLLGQAPPQPPPLSQGGGIAKVDHEVEIGFGMIGASGYRSE